jgi:hypothetical protein
MLGGDVVTKRATAALSFAMLLGVAASGHAVGCGARTELDISNDVGGGDGGASGAILFGG